MSEIGRLGSDEKDTPEHFMMAFNLPTQDESEGEVKNGTTYDVIFCCHIFRMENKLIGNIPKKTAPVVTKLSSLSPLLVSSRENGNPS